MVGHVMHEHENDKDEYEGKNGVGIVERKGIHGNGREKKGESTNDKM